MTLTHVDLFSGIGGFALAARWAGIKTVQFVEIDPFCQKVLQKNFPGVPIHDDIKTFTNAGCERQIERPFLLTGGFPCQPFSCAGLRKGTDDDRHLWPEMLRVIQELRPRWVVAENVYGIVNLKGVVEQGGDADLDGETPDDFNGDGDSGILVSILADLEQAGYSVQACVVPAAALGAPHRRDRVWILGRRKDADDSKSGGCGILYSEDIGETSTQVNASAMPDRHARNSEGVPNRLDAPEHEGREDDPGRPEQDEDAPDSDTSGLQEPWAEQRTSGMRQSIQGGECWSQPWAEVAARFCRVDARVPNRVDRLKSLGNAIVPQVASELMRAILEAEGGK